MSAQAKGPQSRSGKLRAANRQQPVATAAYNIPKFCNAHGISEAFYYKLRGDGLGPDETRLGKKNKVVLITAEAAARWRAERERASAKKKKQQQAKAAAEAAA